MISPSDQAAERAVLGSLLLGDWRTADTVWSVARVDDFTGAHQSLAAVLLDLHEHGKPTDPVVVASICRQQGARGVDAVYLHGLVEGVPTITNVAHYVEQLRDATCRRELHAAGRRLVEHAASYPSPAELADSASGLLASVADRLADTGTGEESQTIDELLARDASYDWLIDGLMERGDRLILTGFEGQGKSMMLRQFAVAVAAGMHPFDQVAIAPHRVLLIDGENSWRLAHRKIGPLVGYCRFHGYDPADRLRVEFRTGGLDILSPDDEQWLRRKVEANRPDVLIIGPLYKVARADPKDEAQARYMSEVFDRLRSRYGIGIVIEAHSPQGAAGLTRALRPFGSSLWLRWPEFGYGLRRHPEDEQVCSLETWRGDRDERGWPLFVRRGKGWPWVPCENPSTTAGTGWS